MAMAGNGGTAAGERCPVFVDDDQPARRLGLVAALEAGGFRVEEPPDATAWLAGDAPRVAVLSRSDDDAAEAALHRLRAADGALAPLVCLLLEATPDACRRMLQAGATAALGQQADIDEVVAAVTVAASGRTVIPASAAQALAHGRVEEASVELSGEESAWLTALARGATVTEIAGSAAYSEREMYRLLRRLYERLGASNRSRALLNAQQQGLIR